MIPSMNFATTAHLAVSYPEDWVTLNPQPLPPKESQASRPGDAVSLNPQPLPPKETSRGSQPGDAVSLNPQPLPPKEVFARMEAALRASGLNPGAERGIIIVGGKDPGSPSEAHSYGERPGYWVSLNPQPLPPKDVLHHVETALRTSGVAERGIIIVGGKNFEVNPGANQGIIIVGGKIRG